MAIGAGGALGSVAIGVGEALGSAAIGVGEAGAGIGVGEAAAGSDAAKLTAIRSDGPPRRAAARSFCAKMRRKDAGRNYRLRHQHQKRRYLSELEVMKEINVERIKLR